VNADDRVGAVVLAAEHLLDLGRLDLAFESIKRALQIVGDVLTLASPVEEHTEVVDFAPERVSKLAFVAQAPPALQRFLRLGLVLPKIRRGDARLEPGQLDGGAGNVKDSSEDRWLARAGPGSVG
jgi:hypothetical protein